MSKNAHLDFFWKHVPIFLSVARHGSFSAAASAVGADRTTVSRRIETIEQTLSQKLFDRVDGRLVLTAAGRQLFVASENAEEQMSSVSLLDEARDFKQGRLRITLPDHLLIAASSVFYDFTQTHPDILLEITATDRIADLRQFEADIAFRLSSGSSRSLRTKRIGRPQFSLYKRKGSNLQDQTYLARPDERAVPDTIFDYVPRARIGMSVDGLVPMKELIAAGAGFGILPDYLGAGDERIEICSDALPTRDLWLTIVYLPEMRNLQRLKVFVSFMEKRLGEMSVFSSGSSPQEDKSMN